MKRFSTALIYIIMCMAASAQNNGVQPADDEKKDLWTRSIDCPMPAHWRNDTISVAGKGEPHIVDFLRAFTSHFPSEYYQMLMAVVDGDTHITFNRAKPKIFIDRDSCYFSHESFSMRIIFEEEKAVALGVTCHKPLSSDAQDAYYYRYDSVARRLVPYCQGSDFTDGIVKRQTSFPDSKDHNSIEMNHRWGRCGVDARLRWERGQLVYKGPDTSPITVSEKKDSWADNILDAVTTRAKMELRDAKAEPEGHLEGGTYLSLPICVAVRSTPRQADYAEALSMEGFYYFSCRLWHRSDGSTVAAVLTECAQRKGFLPENTNALGYHKLGTGNELSLHFYECKAGAHEFVLNNNLAADAPGLGRNEWRCVMQPGADVIRFIRESDCREGRLVWDGNRLVADEGLRALLK